mgnify:CR=1 FL=1
MKLMGGKMSREKFIGFELYSPNGSVLGVNILPNKKNPSLYVRKDNQYLILASFVDEEKALKVKTFLNGLIGTTFVCDKL